MPLYNPGVVRRQIATGNYAGDNTEDRQITCGFKPTLVEILCLNQGAIITIGATLSRTAAGGAAEHFEDLAAHYMHATDGFVVSLTASISMNSVASTYYWWAIE